MALSQTLAGATSFEDLLVRAVVNATRALREDEHLRLMLATEPGEVVHELTVHGLPVILRVATDFLTPWFDPYIDDARSAELAELLSRLVISYFLAPSTHYDLADPASAASFIAQFITPCLRRAASRPLTAGRERNRVVHRPVAQRERRPPPKPRPPSDPGRADLNDIEAILSVANTDVDEISHAVADNADAIFTWDYSLARPALRKLYEKAKTGQWNATTDLPWDTEVDLEKVGRGRPGRHRRGPRPEPLRGHGRRELGRQGVARVRRREPALDPQPVHARRAGRAALHGQDHRDRAVVRRQALRLDPGRRRGAPRGGVRPLPRREARRRLPDQRPPADAARRHRQRQPVGHDLPGHAGDGGGPGPGRLRLHAPDDRGAPPQAAPPLRDERRGPSRGLRRAVAAGGLRGHDRRRDQGPPGVRLRGCRPHARPLPVAGGVAALRGQPQGGRAARAPRPQPRGVPAAAVLQDRAELQEARPARPQRRLAAPSLRGDGRHPVRGLGRHRRGVHRLRARRRGARGLRAALPWARAGAQGQPSRLPQYARGRCPTSPTRASASFTRSA